MKGKDCIAQSALYGGRKSRVTISILCSTSSPAYFCMYGSLYEASLGRNELKLQISSDTKIEVFDSNKLNPTLSLSTAYSPKNRNSGSKRDSAQRRAVGQRQKPGQNVIVWESPVPPPSHDSADGFSVWKERETRWWTPLRKPPADGC